MRDLFKTLDILKSETVMEYCNEFDGIKSILVYCHKQVKPFNKLYFRGGKTREWLVKLQFFNKFKCVYRK